MHGKQPLVEYGFRRMDPSPLLIPFVHSYWEIAANDFTSKQQPEFMHSHGSLSLLFNWGDDLEMSGGCYSKSVYLEPVGLKSRRIILAGRVKAFGILFRPGRVFQIFGIPMTEMTSIDGLHTLKVSELYEQLASIPTFHGKVQLIESWLLKLLESDKITSKIIPSSLKLITDSQGKEKIPQIADKLNLSERQLERIFCKEVGLTPIKYAQLVRLQQARAALEEMIPSALSDIADAAGYYDQAHFNRNFKKYIGVTPMSYISHLLD